MSEATPSELLVELRARTAALTRALRAGRGGEGVDPAAPDDAQKVVDACERFEALWMAYLRHDHDPEESVESQRKRRHDLRTPVGHVIGYLELLGEGFEDVENPGPDVRAWTAELERLLGKAASLREAVDRELKNRMPSPPPRPSASRRPAAGGRLLLIDDDEENLGLITRQLQRDGHLVIQARTGASGLELLASERPDLVLLDIMMPDMDGHETLAHIRDGEVWRDVPVIMMSSLDDVDEAARCLDAGAQDHLMRPVVPEVMRARVAALLDRKRLVDKLREQHDELAAAKSRIGDFVHYVLPLGARLASARDHQDLVDDLLGASVRFAKAGGGSMLMQDMDSTGGWRAVSSIGEGKASLEEAARVAAGGEAQTTHDGGWALPLLDLEGHAQAVLVLHGLPEGELVRELDPLLSLSQLAAAAIERAEYERELRNKIDRLQVEVDARAQRREVQAITETEYFQELRQRATEIRAQARANDGSSTEDDESR